MPKLAGRWSRGRPSWGKVEGAWAAGLGCPETCLAVVFLTEAPLGETQVSGGRWSFSSQPPPPHPLQPTPSFPGGPQPCWAPLPAFPTAPAPSKFLVSMQGWLSRAQGLRTGWSRGSQGKLPTSWRHSHFPYYPFGLSPGWDSQHDYFGGCTGLEPQMATPMALKVSAQHYGVGLPAS